MFRSTGERGKSSDRSDGQDFRMGRQIPDQPGTADRLLGSPCGVPESAKTPSLCGTTNCVKRWHSHGRQRMRLIGKGFSYEFVPACAGVSVVWRGTAGYVIKQEQRPYADRAI